jgi:transposase
MYNKNDIIMAVDYHDKNLTIRWFNCHTGEERMLKRPTTAEDICRLIDAAVSEALSQGGQVIWIMESTTGWARVKQLIGSRTTCIVANVLQMPLPPKAYRRKTDKIDTGRMLREYLNGTLPQAFQPSVSVRRIRRLVALRENLVSRRTALRNWMDRYLAHETWDTRTGLWSKQGIRRLRKMIHSTPEPDQTVLTIKLAELEQLERWLAPIENKIIRIYQHWRQAQRLGRICGIAAISAVSILARVWPIQRFASAEELIAYAGLSPGIRESDQTLRVGRIGGGGTDKHLRHYLIEASIWARRIPRYRPTYERVMRKRGKKIGRLVVARMLLRSIYKMLECNVRFNQMPKQVG